jgi:hypothetical protein
MRTRRACIAHALEHGQATLADFVYNQTAKGAPWKRWS